MGFPVFIIVVLVIIGLLSGGKSNTKKEVRKCPDCGSFDTNVCGWCGKVMWCNKCGGSDHNTTSC